MNLHFPNFEQKPLNEREKSAATRVHEHMMKLETGVVVTTNDVAMATGEAPHKVSAAFHNLKGLGAVSELAEMKGRSIQYRVDDKSKIPTEVRRRPKFKGEPTEAHEPHRSPTHDSGEASVLADEIMTIAVRVSALRGKTLADYTDAELRAEIFRRFQSGK